MNTKQRIASLREADKKSERIAKVLSYIITAILATGGAAYCLKGAVMQIAANWTF